MREQTMRQREQLEQMGVSKEIDMTSFYITRFCAAAIIVFLLIAGFIKVVIPYLQRLLGH